MPLVPDVISRLCSTVPTEMRHSRDIVQACPGGGPVIPNQSLAEQRLERKIRTQEFRFRSFFQWMLNSKTAPPHTPPAVASACFTSALIPFYSSLPSHYIDHFYLVSHVSRRFYTPLCGADIFSSWQTPPHAPQKIWSLSPALLSEMQHITNEHWSV